MLLHKSSRTGPTTVILLRSKADSHSKLPERSPLCDCGISHWFGLPIPRYSRPLESKRTVFQAIKPVATAETICSERHCSATVLRRSHPHGRHTPLSEQCSATIHENSFPRCQAGGDKGSTVSEVAELMYQAHMRDAMSMRPIRKAGESRTACLSRLVPLPVGCVPSIS